MHTVVMQEQRPHHGSAQQRHVSELQLLDHRPQVSGEARDVESVAGSVAGAVESLVVGNDREVRTQSLDVALEAPVAAAPAVDEHERGAGAAARVAQADAVVGGDRVGHAVPEERVGGRWGAGAHGQGRQLNALTRSSTRRALVSLLYNSALTKSSEGQQLAEQGAM